MEVRHNTSLLEKAVEHSVHNASIPGRAAEAAARQVEAKAQAFRRLATGTAIAIAAVGVGFGIWLAVQEPKNADPNPTPAEISALEKQLQDASRENTNLRLQQEESRKELDALRSQKDPSRVDPQVAEENSRLQQERSEQQQALEEANRTITDLRQRLDSITGGDPLTNYSIFKNKLVSYKGTTWEVSTGHEFASNLDKQWRAAWCYVTPDVEGIRLKVDLVERAAPTATPRAPVASPQTLEKAGLQRQDAIYLASQCDWLDGKTFSEKELDGNSSSTSEEASLSQQGDVLIYKGEINQIFFDRLRTSEFKKLVITSDGGSIPLSLQAGEILRSKNAAVEVRDRCFSSCVFVVAGGSSRSAEAGAQIGVHQFYFVDSPDSASATAMAQQTSSLIVQYLESKGVDPELFHEMVQVPSAQILVLPIHRLIAWRLINSYPSQSPGTEAVTLPESPKEDFNTKSERLVFEARDMLGGDGSIVKGISQEDCEANCRGDALCKGYTYDRWNRVCLLKSGMGLLRLEPRSITVLFSEKAPRESNAAYQMTKRNGRAFPNTPYKTSSASGYDQCADVCMQDTRCLGVNYSIERRCELFAAPSEYAPRTGFSLGIKSQVSSAQ